MSRGPRSASLIKLLVLVLVLVLGTLLGPGRAEAAECCVSYAPTNFDPTIGMFPDDDSLREDLQVLHSQGFTCLTTYASDGTLNRIPAIAKEVGFDTVYMGIFCPTSSAEIDSALAQSAHVDAYVIGNEGLGANREFCPYGITELAAAMTQVSTATGLPVTTSEESGDYFSGPFASWLRTNGDFIFPNLHPFWAGLTTPEVAVDWTVVQYEALSALTALGVILKETGMPTSGCPACNPAAQEEFYDLLSNTAVEFFYFEAFDQPWKNFHPVEPHWGINESDRSAKDIVGCHRVTSVESLQDSSWGRIKSRYRSVAPDAP